MGPGHTQNHTSFSTRPGVRGVGGRGREHRSTIPRAGTLGSAQTKQLPRSFLPISNPAPAQTPTRRNPAFPGRGRHQWNSPEAGSTGYPATEVIHQLASGRGEGGQPSLRRGKLAQLSQYPHHRHQMPKGRSGEALAPEPRARSFPGID